MDKIKINSGGMPLRLDDFDVIQVSTLAGFTAIIKAFVGNNACIMSGIVVSGGTGSAQVSEGYYFDGAEIFYVPSATFSYDSQKILHLVPNFIDTESRIFADSVSRDCWQTRQYQVAYANPIPQGGVRIDNLIRLTDYQTEYIVTQISQGCGITGMINVPYLYGYTPATSYQYIRVQGNQLNQRMIHAAFTTDSSSGKIGILPVGLRPTSDIVGYYRSGANALGMMIIKKDGGIWVMNASTSDVNYITFQYLQQVEDSINYNVPVGSGGGMS